MRWMKCVLSLVLLLSLAMMPALGSESYPKTIVDDANRTITIEKPVDKIIPLVTWSYEPLRLLGAEDKIVGITSDAKTSFPWLSGIQNKPIVGNYREHNYEKIIEIQPDIIITQARFANSLDKNLSGIKVVVLDFSNQEGFERDLTLLAELVGGQDKALSFLEWRSEQLGNLQEKIVSLKSDEKKRVYIEWSNSPWLTAGMGTAKDTLITRAGGLNIAHNFTSPRPIVDPEWVLKKNPQAIIYSATLPISELLTGYYVNDTDIAKEYLEKEKSRDGLKGTEAVTEDNLYVLDQICVEATRNFIGAQYLAKWLYPKKTGDLDPDAIHKEYFEKWLDMPYKGVWAYPDK